MSLRNTWHQYALVLPGRAPIYFGLQETCMFICYKVCSILVVETDKKNKRKQENKQRNTIFTY